MADAKKGVGMKEMIYNRCRFITMFMAIGLLCSSMSMQSSYTVGALDTTDNGGTGFGSATPESATGYTTYSSATTDFIINASAIQPDGKTVVAGSWSAGTGVAQIIRYNINGTLDDLFGTDGAVSLSLTGMIAVIATGVAIQTDGKIVVAGTCLQTAGAIPSYFIARFIPDGTLDATAASSSPFTAAGYIVNNIGAIINATHATTTSVDQPNALAIDSSGKIVVAGTTTITQTSASTTQDIFVAQYSTLGLLDTGAFNIGSAVGGTNLSGVLTVLGIALISMSDTIPLTGNAIAFDAIGNILVTGSQDTSQIDVFIARFLSSGVLDTSFNSSGTPGYNIANLNDDHGSDIGYAVGVQSATNFNRIVVAGTTGAKAVLVGFQDSGY